MKSKDKKKHTLFVVNLTLILNQFTDTLVLNCLAITNHLSHRRYSPPQPGPTLPAPMYYSANSYAAPWTWEQQPQHFEELLYPPSGGSTVTEYQFYGALNLTLPYRKCSNDRVDINQRNFSSNVVPRPFYYEYKALVGACVEIAYSSICPQGAALTRGCCC